MALGIAVSAWAAEPKVTDQKIRDGGVTVNIPVVKGAVGGVAVDESFTKKKINPLIGCYRFRVLCPWPAVWLMKLL